MHWHVLADREVFEQVADLLERVVVAQAGQNREQRKGEARTARVCAIAQRYQVPLRRPPLGRLFVAP